MKARGGICWALLFGGVMLASELSVAFPEEAFFEKLAGSWHGVGSLVNSDGEEISIVEDWTAAYRDDDTFAIEGNRQWGDDSQEFRWVYRFNPTTELFECDYWHTGMENDLRFEVSLSESRVEMMAPFGDPGSELRISNEFSDESLAGEVKMTTAQGETVLSGTVHHEKEG